jgi:Mce-associated membrane protein
MSPRRQIQPGEEPLLVERIPETSRWSRCGQRALPIAMAVAVLLGASAAIAVPAYVFYNHRSHHQAAMKEVDVLGFARSFMTGFTSVDPFHANDYVDRLLKQATGDFAKKYREKINEITLSVAQAEPTKGTPLEAGVERWNDDGSASVLVVIEVAYKSPDRKQTIENTSRWVLNAQREGNQWKISSLQQVI